MLVTFEMLLLSLLTNYAYSYKDYIKKAKTNWSFIKLNFLLFIAISIYMVLFADIDPKDGIL